MGPIAKLRALGSVLRSRADFAAQAGLTFGGARDLYEVLGYPRDITLTDYRERYERDCIAAAVVERPPEATWRGGGELIEDQNPTKDTEFETAWVELDDRLHVWPMFAKSDILAGLGRFGVIFIGAPGAINSELPQLSSANDVMYLTAFSEEYIEDPILINDPANPRFGQPEFYRIRGLGGMSNTNSGI